MATLREIAGRIEEFDPDDALTMFVEDDDVVGPESQVFVGPEQEAGGRRYLLECFVAAEVVHDWEATHGAIDADARSRLIAHYAEHDAYPDTLT